MDTTANRRPRPVVMTRQDRTNRCRNCGHDEFIILERGVRDAVGYKMGVDVERCERCNVARHS